MSSIEIVPYSENHYSQWEAFIDNAINGTIFHRQKFLGYHPPGRFDDHSLLFFEKNKLLGVFPAALIRKEGKTVLKSHPGTSYGGLVFNQKIPIRKVFQILTALDEHCISESIERIEFRSAPKIFNACFLDQLDFGLQKHEFRPFEEELATYYSLHYFENFSTLEEFIEQFPSTSKKELKKGLKENLTCQVLSSQSEIKHFYSILSENLGTRFNKSPTHTLDELIYLIGLFPDQIFIYGVFQKDQLIGGYLVMAINQQGWHIFYACQDYNFQQARPLNLALGGLLKLAKDNGIPNLNYGISTEEGGEHINWGLYRFKEDFGGTGVLRTYWMKELA